jgi:rod shape-determining protein MreD
MWGVAFAALLLQAFLPLVVPMARLLDMPLLIVLYFALLRRDKIFGTLFGTALGLVMDALSHRYIGVYGMAQALVGYLAASASIRFNLESLTTRTVLTAVLVLVQGLFLQGLLALLFEFPPPFRPLELASGVLANVALGLVIYQLLDRLRRPA